MRRAYPEISTRYNDRGYMTSRTILAPTNADVDRINAIATMELFCPEAPYHEYLSVYSTYDQLDLDSISVDFLNTLTPKGLSKAFHLHSLF